jgi:hypothetical protein
MPKTNASSRAATDRSTELHDCTRCGYARSAHPSPIGQGAPYDYKGWPVCNEYKTGDVPFEQGVGKHHLGDVSTDHETKALRNPSDPDAGADRGATLLYYRGPFRVYFNRKEDAPRVVSIDNGSHAWEINAKTLKIEGVQLKSEFHGSATGNAPCFWLEGIGEVLVDANGNARIVGV